MMHQEPAKYPTESPQRIEPTAFESIPPALADLAAELASESAALGRALHPQTAASLADLVRIMNAYYSNLIEGHNTRPRDIQRALAGELDADETRRNLQIEARSHVRVQATIDALAREGRLPEPASREFISFLHREFYDDAPEAMLHVRASKPSYRMVPGAWRSTSDDDVVVGRLVPPVSSAVPRFMEYFEKRFQFAAAGKSARIFAVAIAHHRLNYIHPFPDGNGRVSRLMSHAMAHEAGIGAHGLWSISRGLARGLTSRSDYKSMMDLADTPRENDLDGRGNLSLRALTEYVTWFLRVCLDQVRFMASLFELDTLADRLRALAEINHGLRPEASLLLEHTLARGALERSAVPRLLGTTERTGRRIVHDLTELGLLESRSSRAPLTLRFTPDSAETLFPRLFPLA